MDGKMSLVALVILTVLAWMGVRHLQENGAAWRFRVWQSYTRFTMRHGMAASTATTMMKQLGLRAIEPVLFTGFFVLTLMAWILVMLAAGLGPILTALSIAFPGAAIAYHVALLATRFCRRYMEKGET